eukprot:TRINITY_DN13573_c0_g1_i1.p1 TRINITY_DN13573_c0_g1~~TRINITY_DN13573_c0_g1_i1.p1  ORF type:complete len:456 (-),score=64.89 TRINITY_DN13573_c0_g1_i1:73-1440(-)
MGKRRQICCAIAVAVLAVIVTLSLSPPIIYPLCAIAGRCPEFHKFGFALAGWEDLQQDFEKQFYLGRNYGAQLAVMRDGNLVAHLSMGQRSPFGTPYTLDTLQNVFSSGKLGESLAIALLIDRGYTSFDQKVSSFWPEFSAHGKENITVAMVMQHRAGLPYFSNPIGWDLLHDDDAFATFLAAHPPVVNITDNTQMAYHATTRGYLVNQLVRRLDPLHRNLSAFLVDEVATPLGIEWYVGLPEHLDDRVATLVTAPWYYLVFNYVPRLFLPDWVSIRVWPNDDPVHPVAIKQLWKMADRSSGFSRALTLPEPFQSHDIFTRRVRAAPNSSGLTITTALGLVAVAEVLRSGSYNGTRLLSDATVQLAAQHQGPRLDVLMQYPFTFTNGGWAAQFFAGASGWAGMGGSLVMFDEGTGLAFGFCMNQMGVSLVDERGKMLLDVALRIAREKERETGNQ